MFGHKYRSCPNRTRNLVRHLQDLDHTGQPIAGGSNALGKNGVFDYFNYNFLFNFCQDLMELAIERVESYTLPFISFESDLPKVRIFLALNFLPWEFLLKKS